MKCPKCRRENEGLAHFCFECGFSFRHASESDTRGKPHRHDRGSVLQGSANERRHVTVLFSDLAGYTTMSEKLDPEQVSKILDHIFAEITQVVKKYEGSIDKFIGDAVMVFFGLPSMHEDDAERAVMAALEIHDRVEAVSPRFQEMIGGALVMHTGINSGLVVSGETDIKKGRHGTVGSTINIASRLSDIAKPGEILVGPSTYHQVSRYIEFKQSEPTSIKGVTEPIQVYKVIDPKGQVRPTYSTRTLRSDLMGRKLELAKLAVAVHSIGEGNRGGIVSVIGDAGIGKSRLIAEVKTQLSDERIVWLEGRALSFGQTMSYWPFLEIIKTYTGIVDSDDEVTAWQKLESGISVLFPDRFSEILPYMALLLALEIKGELEEKIKYLDGKTIGHQIFRVSRQFFERLAKDRSLVLVFEDLHWSDQSSIELLEHLLPLVKNVPLL